MEEKLLKAAEGGRVVGKGGGARHGSWAEKLWKEVKAVGYLAGPMVAVSISSYLVQVISTMMVGHLGELELAGSSIAASLSTVTGFSLILGLASGLETLSGQAFGAQQYRKLGIDLYKATFILLLVCVPISVLWLNTGKLLVVVGQKPEIAAEAGKYIAWMIPALFGYAVLMPLTKFLQVQSLVLPLTLSFVLTLSVHAPLCWVLVFRTGMRNSGAALAIGVAFWVNAAVLGAYVRFSGACEQTRAPLTRESFRGAGEFLRLAVPAALMMCFEWWSFELMVLLSGLLPKPELETSVLSICVSAMTTIYCVTYGIGAAASTRVSNELGAGDPDGARLAVRASLCIAAAEAVAVSAAIFSLRSVLGYAYSEEAEVVRYVRKMAPVVSFSVFMDGLQGVFSGVARGCGWQDLGSYINLGSFYLLGIPVAALLGFGLKLKGLGLWVGMACGATTQTVLLGLVTYFINWQKQVDKARERTTGKQPSLVSDHGPLG